MVQPIIKNSYLAEINLVTVTQNQRYNFDNIPELNQKNIKLVSVTAYTATRLLLSQTGKTVIADAAAANFVLTLTTAESEVIYQIPYYDLVSANNAGLMRMFKNLSVNLTKCYATCLSTTGVVAAQSLVFNLIYETM